MFDTILGDGHGFRAVGCQDGDDLRVSAVLGVPVVVFLVILLGLDDGGFVDGAVGVVDVDVWSGVDGDSDVLSVVLSDVCAVAVSISAVSIAISVADVWGVVAGVVGVGDVQVWGEEFGVVD